MTLKEIKGRLKTLRVKCDHDILQPEEIEPLVKQAATHFGLAEELVKVECIEKKLTYQFQFLYNGKVRASYHRLFEKNIHLCWLEACALTLISDVLVEQNPAMTFDIRHLFNKHM